MFLPPLHNVSVAKKSSMFNDPTVEIQELTALIKDDITALNVAVADLQNLHNMEMAKNYSDDKAIHANAICDDIKNRLMAVTKQFQEVLTARTEARRMWKFTSSCYALLLFV